jgi:hypothetical protein
LLPHWAILLSRVGSGRSEALSDDQRTAPVPCAVRCLRTISVCVQRYAGCAAYLALSHQNEGRRLRDLTGASRSGVLDPHHPPLSVGGIAAAPRDTADQPVGPLTPRGLSRVLTGTTRMRKARNQTFRKPLPEQGNRRCAFPGRRYQSPVAAQITGRHAAHVVPGASSGSDHLADGRLFSKTCIGPSPTPRRVLRHQRGAAPNDATGHPFFPARRL